jgi:AraC-like DNA-binding protein
MAESAFTQGQTLAKVPIFSGLAENELSFLAQRALTRRYLAGELKQENGDENFVERIRIAIQQKLTGRRPNVEDIADALHISSRTLQRRLQDQGSSFQRVLEEARHQLARHYLNNSVLELNEAAYLLGYQDGNSFVRAFRNWEGVPPSRWREQQRAKAAS